MTPEALALNNTARGEIVTTYVEAAAARRGLNVLRPMHDLNGVDRVIVGRSGRYYPVQIKTAQPNSTGHYMTLGANHRTLAEHAVDFFIACDREGDKIWITSKESCTQRWGFQLRDANLHRWEVFA